MPSDAGHRCNAAEVAISVINAASATPTPVLA
ncbi:hypothetical protein GcM1_184013 [Golovinomyces cichoracearum]|uniref:Uncharacterized protein n=1 Tax=Golovinomyces cichoracearum TaxID=62708 RepID=A0A420J3I1_9PEZI|nr:hypothetical protein GcM1_184013 [Golovinomyces cichoracearum]